MLRKPFGRFNPKVSQKGRPTAIGRPFAFPCRFSPFSAPSESALESAPNSPQPSTRWVVSTSWRRARHSCTAHRTVALGAARPAIRRRKPTWSESAPNSPQPSTRWVVSTSFHLSTIVGLRCKAGRKAPGGLSTDPRGVRDVWTDAVVGSTGITRRPSGSRRISCNGSCSGRVRGNKVYGREGTRVGEQTVRQFRWQMSPTNFPAGAVI